MIDLNVLRPLMVALLLASASQGCLGYTRPKLQSNASSVRTELQAASDCEVTLLAEQLHGPNGPFVRDIPRDEVGVTLTSPASARPDGPISKEWASTQTWQAGTCIKRRGQPLSIPSPLWVAAPDIPASFCQGSRWGGAKLGAEQGTAMEVCEWNGFFHAARPFTFTVISKDAPLASYVSLIRVFRNGEQAYQWIGPGDSESRTLVIEGRSLTADGSFVSRSLPPHLSEFDLRFMAAGVELDEGMLTQTILDARARSRERWTTLGFAVMASAQHALDPGTQEALTCFAWQLEDLELKVQRIVDGEAASRPAPPMCKAVELEVGSWSLAGEYRAHKATSREAVVAARAKAEALLAALTQVPAGPDPSRSSPLAEAIRSAGKALDAAAVRLNKQPDELRSMLGNYDALLRSAAQSVERARDLATKLESEALRFSRDERAQMAAFQDLANRLSEQPDIFDTRRDNPALLDREQMLRMSYGDKFQGFVLAPWFGVPFSLSGPITGANLEASVVIPIIDAVGFRIQFGASRLSDMRVGLGMAAFQDQDLTEAGKRDVFNLASQASLGFGTVKLALGMVMNNREVFEGEPARRLRLLVGADLLKLVTGKNVELW